MNTSIDLTQLVIDRINMLGSSEASRQFGVSIPTISAWRNLKNPPSIAAAQAVLNDYISAKPADLWDIQGKRVLILQPIYGQMNGLTHITLFRNYAMYGPEKIGLIPKFRTLIAEARCQLADMALKTDSEWVIFNDSDMILPCGNGAMLRGYGSSLPEPNASFNALSRIMSHPPEYKIVGALYFGRNELNKAQCSNAFESETANMEYHRIRQQGGEYPLQEQRWVGTGFMRVHRSVFETMRARADELFPEIKPVREDRHWGYFVQLGPDRGEDMSFCHRAALCGIPSYLDPSLICGHEGSKIY